MIVAAVLLWVSLYEQSIVRVLNERFPSAEYLLIHAQTGRRITSNWANLDTPLAVGSLTQPFLAHRGVDRVVVC